MAPSVTQTIESQTDFQIRTVDTAQEVLPSHEPYGVGLRSANPTFGKSAVITELKRRNSQADTPKTCFVTRLLRMTRIGFAFTNY